VKKSKDHQFSYQIAFYLIELKYFDLAIPILLKNKIKNKNCFNLLGLCYFGLKKYKLSHRYFKRFLNFATEMSDELMIAEALYNLSTCFWQFKDYNSAIKLNKEALEIEGKILGKYNSSYLISLFSLALNYRVLKRFDDAETLLTQCLDLARNTLSPLSSMFLDLYLTMGANYSDLKKAESSIENYEKATNYFNNEIPLDKNPNYFLQEQYFNIGNIKFYEGNYIDSINYFIKSINLFESIISNNEFLPPYFELGECYRIIGEHNSAIKNYKKAIDCKCFVNEKYISNPKFWIGIEYYELGIALLNDNKREDASQYFKLSLDYLLMWRYKISDIEWRNYINSVIKYINKLSL